MKLLLIDGYGFVFRAYFAFPPLTRSDGQPVGCVYGFVSMLSRILLTNEVDYVGVVLDSGQKNFRHTICEQYKANREKPPEDLILQFPMIREAIEAFDVVSMEQHGLEADDLIAIYSQAAKSQNIDVTIMSSDKDLMQLVDERIRIVDPIKNLEIGVQQVFEKLGVYPEQVSDYLALVGDSADNIRGVRGIGPKRASDLLQRFGSLDNIYGCIDDIKEGRIQKLLIEGRSDAYTAKALSDLRRPYDLSCDLEQLRVRPINKGKLLRFLEAQEFKSLHRNILNIIKGDDSSTGADGAGVEERTEEVQRRAFRIFDDFGDIDVKKIQKAGESAGMIGIYMDSDYLYISASEEHIQISMVRERLDFVEQKDARKEVLIGLKDIFESDAIVKVLADVKFWYKTLSTLGISLSAFEDVILMAYSASTSKSEYNIEALVKLYLGDSFTLNSSSILGVFKRLQRLLYLQRRVYWYDRVEKPLNILLGDMETIGIKVSQGVLISLSEEFKSKMYELEKLIFEEVGRNFLLSSSKQLGEILFEHLKYPKGKKLKSGVYATSSDVLEELSSMGYTLADKILAWKSLHKLLNTYIVGLSKAVDARDGRIRSTFSTISTNTGRLTSNSPNLQAIPIRTEDGAKIRRAFVSEQGSTIISADYSQIELRLLAHIANIDVLKDAFAQRRDIHAITASEVFGVPLEEVDENLRRKAKTINFGIIYGIGPFGLAKRLGISMQVAKEYIEAYFRQYPGIQEYMHNTIEFAKEHGYTETIYGHKCFIDVNEIRSTNFTIRQAAERAAINAPIQGSAADIIKKAMVMMPVHLKRCMILQVHDELLFEVSGAKVEEYSRNIRDVMSSVCNLTVPLDVDIKCGASW
ncbi:DNA polymerase I [Rickettsiales endosymbiont of Peranema trichophorum]|uniref:DNA polymerase I n=1 Tax=Rickettsiales endosymbiont of Peranema trichophorum TaxID=2486577 RepID=UPI0010236A2A|nr:DNA polymerase I [Rickettsiales endosymbiont of Peranema trichophorum]RZI45547.1 DNA polymerase I [Rickettsiales endosymbiont of Peranema trichophorum]